MTKVTLAQQIFSLTVHFFLAVAATCVTVAAIYYLISAERSGREEIAVALGHVDNRLKSMESIMQERSIDRWTKNDMDSWLTEMGTKNPQMIIPPISKPKD